MGCWAWRKVCTLCFSWCSGKMGSNSLPQAAGAALEPQYAEGRWPTGGQKDPREAWGCCILYLLWQVSGLGWGCQQPKSSPCINLIYSLLLWGHFKKYMVSIFSKFMKNLKFKHIVFVAPRGYMCMHKDT